MFLFLSASGFILSLILLVFKARRYTPTIYLGFFFLFSNMYALAQYVVLSSKSVFLVALFFSNLTLFNYLIGPMLYWYVRSIITDSFSLKRKDWWHLLPMGIYLAAIFPYVITPWSYKIQIANEIVKQPGFLGIFEATYLSHIFSNAVVYLSRPLLVCSYTVWSIVLFLRYLKQNEDRFVFAGQHFMTKWMFFLLGFQLILVVSHLISVYETFLFSSDVFLTFNYLQLLSSIGLGVLLVSPFFFPGILYGLPRFPVSNAKLKSS